MKILSDNSHAVRNLTALNFGAINHSAASIRADMCCPVCCLDFELQAVGRLIIQQGGFMMNGVSARIESVNKRKADC